MVRCAQMCIEYVRPECCYACVASRQLFYECPVVPRRGGRYRGSDTWRQSGGIKGSVVLPREGLPRVRRQYGTIRRGEVVMARYFAYTAVGSGSVGAGEEATPVLFEVLPRESGQRWQAPLVAGTAGGRLVVSGPSAEPWKRPAAQLESHKSLLEVRVPQHCSRCQFPHCG